MSDCESCRCKADGSPTIESVDRMLSLSSEPECEATQGQCVPRRVRHLIDACIGYRQELAAERDARRKEAKAFAERQARDAARIKELLWQINPAERMG